MPMPHFQRKSIIRMLEQIWWGRIHSTWKPLRCRSLESRLSVVLISVKECLYFAFSDLRLNGSAGFRAINRLLSSVSARLTPSAETINCHRSGFSSWMRSVSAKRRQKYAILWSAESTSNLLSTPGCLMVMDGSLQSHVNEQIKSF